MPGESTSGRGSRFTGRVALVTGAARGQGRAHALALAAEGADVILVDSAAHIDTVAYQMPSPDDLDTVAKEIADLDRRTVTLRTDVRDVDVLAAAVAAAVDELGRLDVVVANAGILGAARRSWEMTAQEWNAVIDVNLTGVWATLRAAVPHMIEAGNGGSVIIISSIAGLNGIPGVANYVAAKHGLVGLGRSVANETAEYGIRVNTIHPTNVRTPMIDNPVSARIFRPDLENPTLDDGAAVLQNINLLRIPWVDVQDVTAAVLWLASDESRYITGVALPVDGGMLTKYHA
jgi:SDR family mycofactocin-dependent oxidoreductase